MTTDTMVTVAKVEDVARKFEACLIKTIEDGGSYITVCNESRRYRDLLHEITMNAYEADDFAVSDASSEAYSRLCLITDTLFAATTAAHNAAIAAIEEK